MLSSSVRVVSRLGIDPAAGLMEAKMLADKKTGAKVWTVSDNGAEETKLSSDCGRVRNVRNFDPSVISGVLSDSCRECVSKRYGDRSEELVAEYPFSFSDPVTVIPGADEKTCSLCRVTKPVNEFNRDKSKRDGLQSQCVECRVSVTHKRRTGR